MGSTSEACNLHAESLCPHSDNLVEGSVGVAVGVGVGVYRVAC